jgi:hypothetical protein
MAPILVGVAVVAVVVVAVGAVVAYRRHQEQARYCEVYDQTHARLAESASSSQRATARSSYSDLQESVTAMNAALAERRDAAPGSLRDSWDVIITTKSSESLSAKKAVDEAVTAVNDYARDVCGLDGDM